MSVHPIYVDGQLREEWNDVNHVYRAWNEQGTLVDERPYTPEEVAIAEAYAKELASQGNHHTLDQRAEAALQANKDYLALGSRTNAQVAKQVEDLTKQMNGVIRLLTGRLDATD